MSTQGLETSGTPKQRLGGLDNLRHTGSMTGTSPSDQVALDRCSDTPKSRAEGPALRNSCLHWPAPEPGPYIHFLQDPTSGSAVASGLPSPGNPFQPTSLHSCLSRTPSCFGRPHPTPAALPLVGAPSPSPLPVPLLLSTHHLPWESCLPPPLSLHLNPSSRPLPPRPCVYPQA